MAGFWTLLRGARRARRRGAAPREAVLPLSASMEALGGQFWTDLGVADVPVDRVVGTVSRVDDFDRAMRPLRPHLRGRWETVAAGVKAGRGLPPVRLVRLGELYFVVDGHHRVSVARANGQVTIEARVRRLCTVAYACHCLTLLDLPNKAAERRFLERFPLPDDVRPWLWLNDPADWSRIEDGARRWLDEHLAAVDVDDAAGAEQLLEKWWRREVLPTAHSCQGADRVWLDDYLCALRDRDTGGCCLV